MSRDANQVIKAVYDPTLNALRVSGGAPVAPGTVESDAGAAAVDLETTPNRTYYIELVENVSFSLDNPMDGDRVSIIVQQDAGGANSFTIAETVAWEGGDAPTVTQTGLAVDVYTLLWSDDLAMWLGAAIQDFQTP